MCMLSKIIDTYQLEGGGGGGEGGCAHAHTHTLICACSLVCYTILLPGLTSLPFSLQKVKGNEDLTAQCVHVCLASCVTITKCH